jgi:cell division protein FtsB
MPARHCTNMSAVIAILLLLLLVAAGTLVAVLSIRQDKRQELQRELGATREQNNQLQEKYRNLQSQWEEKFRKARERFGKVMDLDDEADRVRLEIRALNDLYHSEKDQISTKSAKLRQEYDALADSYKSATDFYERLKREVSLVEENLEDISYGLYKPHYSFDTSEQYRELLDEVRSQKKQMVRDDKATQCLVQWTVSGSQRDGERMQKQLAKLMLRAFNGETDAAVGNCTWNNVKRMEERIKRAFIAINQLGTVVQVAIVPQYQELALEELRLTFEYQEKKRAEAEEQREIRERMREEERVQRELERAQAETAAEEARYSRALAKARDEVRHATGTERAELMLRIRELETDLAAAHAEHERAVSMAQLTKCGYVYIISNIGSFGEDMYKLGLTRRLDPMDRIKELGDASVPFSFDVHAMVYSEDAPTLECALHQHFREKSVNLINPRKEFFHVTLEEIESFVTSRRLPIRITKLAEAREYRESITLREQKAKANGRSRDAFPPVLPACVTT